MGPIETAVRKEIPDSTALAEVAYTLAEALDEKSGGASAARELRALLAELRPKRSDGIARMQLVVEDDDDETPFMEGGHYVNGEKVR
jgi:hypothetical protein